MVTTLTLKMVRNFQMKANIIEKDILVVMNISTQAINNSNNIVTQQ